MASDVVAGFRSMAGGEVKHYSAVLAQGREQAVQRTIEEGEKTGANATSGEVGSVDGDVWICRVAAHGMVAKATWIAGLSTEAP